MGMGYGGGIFYGEWLVQLEVFVSQYEGWEVDFSRVEGEVLGF